MMSLLTLQKAEKRPLNEQKQLIQQALSSITVSDESDDFMLTGDCAVELRRVELLSESSLTRPSPSAVCGSDFPRTYAHRQE